MPDYSFKKVLYTYWDQFNVDCMAIGGLFALLHFKKKEAILRILYNKYLQWGVLVFTLVAMFSGTYFTHYLFFEIYSVLFGILILNFATNPDVIFSMEYKLPNYLGKISYGIYMYHCIVIIIVLKSLIYFGLLNNGLIYALVILLTILVSSLSYRFFEEPFIKLKSRFSKILSGDNAKAKSTQPVIPEGVPAVSH